MRAIKYLFGKCLFSCI